MIEGILIGFIVGIIFCLIILYTYGVIKEWRENQFISHHRRIDTAVNLAQTDNHLARQNIWKKLRELEDSSGLEYFRIIKRLDTLEKKKRKKTA